MPCISTLELGDSVFILCTHFQVASCAIVHAKILYCLKFGSLLSDLALHLEIEVA
jgi:hypothetical protein